MAVTKTHPIKSTLKAAIDYICNPDKTDGKLLVSSFGCTAETANIEFAWTRRHAIDTSPAPASGPVLSSPSSWGFGGLIGQDLILPYLIDLFLIFLYLIY